MEIKAADVMKLRKMTGAGMMDCKKALIEAEGDYERAKDIIREKGKLVVSKRADRSASEGVVVTKIVGQKAYLLCLACETDFVAQNSEFSASANAILDIAVANDAADVEALKAIKNADGITVEEMVTEKSGQTGEKVELAYYGRIEAPYCNASFTSTRSWVLSLVSTRRYLRRLLTLSQCRQLQWLLSLSTRTTAPQT